MAKKRQPKVKVVRIAHGLLGNPNNYRIEKAMNKWMSKGYRLDKQQAEGWGLRGYTLLTFIEELKD